MRKARSGRMCPCGSGRPLDSCCGLNQKVVSLTRVRWRRAGQLLRRRLGEFADSQFYAREASRAQELYFDLIPPEIADQEDDFTMERCFEWYIFDYILSSGRTVIEEFRQTCELDALERQLLADWVDARTTFYEVVGLEKGRWVDLCNILDQTCCRVWDATVAGGVEPGIILYIRVLKVGEEYEFSTGGLALPGLYRAALLKRLKSDFRAFCRKRGPDKSRDWNTFLRDRAHAINAMVLELGTLNLSPALPSDLDLDPFEYPEQAHQVMDRLSAHIAQRITDSFLDDFYEQWIHQGIPALEGKSPLQAVQSATGRAQVEELLRELEKIEKIRARRGEPHYDINKVRRKLGLLPEKRLARVHNLFGADLQLESTAALFDGDLVRWDELKWAASAHAAVARQAAVALHEQGFSARQIQAAVQLWYEFCKKTTLRVRKQQLWAAALVYTVHRLYQHFIPQQALARQFGVSASAISGSYRHIWRVMKLDSSSDQFKK